MKKLLLIPALFLSLNAFSQKITRGPDVGEIYFSGPTTTVISDAIYYSTDFGNSAVCMDSVSQTSHNIVSISADKDNGGIYYVTMGEALYYSDNFGQQGSWEFKHSGIYKNITSGREIGEIYKSFIAHSNNYGENFISHFCNGYFGTLKDVDIDVVENLGYCISKKYNILDTLYFFNTFNNFDDLEVVKKFDFHWADFIDISRENNEGNIFLCNQTTNEIFFSSNYGVGWERKNILTCPYLPIISITGGRQNGELYLFVRYVQLMGQRRHIYIYHSLDYGETYTVYHPVSIGPDPIYADFIAEDTLVGSGDTVQFTDLSNDAETWEWDFDNDGTIDSYEQNPTYIYPDTGYYTVKLSITGEAIQDFGIRYDYIHVDDLTGIKNYIYENKKIIIYPNPAKNNLKIILNDEVIGWEAISFFNSTGKLLKTLYNKKTNQSQNTISIPVSDLQEGIYFVKVSTQNESQTKKIIITH